MEVVGLLRFQGKVMNSLPTLNVKINDRMYVHQSKLLPKRDNY